MRLKNVDKVNPTNDGVVIKILEKEITANGVYLGGNEQATKTNIETYFGEVEKIGPKATESKHCPGLKEKDITIVSQFAGTHIATSDNNLHKLVRGYDITATTTDMNNITEETLTPTSDRLMIKVLHVDSDDDGLILSEQDARDPRLADLDYGVVLKVGDSCDSEVKVGDTVAYDPYVGTTMRKYISDKEPELKVIVEDDVVAYIR